MKAFILSFWVSMILFSIGKAQKIEDTIPAVMLTNMPTHKSFDYYHHNNTCVFDMEGLLNIFSEEALDQIPPIDFTENTLLGMALDPEYVKNVKNKSGVKFIRIISDRIITFKPLSKKTSERVEKNQCWFLIPRTSKEKIDYRLLEYESESFCKTGDTIFQTDSAYRKFIQECGIVITAPINFNKEIVLTCQVGGDCHARYVNSLEKDENSKTITWFLYNIYGGCRAAKAGRLWITIPKPNKEYSFLFQEVLINW